ncbi:MAG: 50S ribosomal protein L21 [Alphaproteobacteria bacterium]|nr:50S ribosomal protein L21 [Alphaproteobacteria bacterium]
MYAVVKTGGKQYRVAKDDVIVVEKLAADAGSALELDEVLILDDGKETVVGTPLVDGARVAATVLDQTRGDKIIVFKKKRRKDYKRKKGHRQDLTVLRITDILAKGQKGSSAKAAAPKAEAAEATPVAETAAKKAPAKKAAKKAPAKK